MKIVCYKDKILKAINSVVKAVASKTTMPILEGILIQTNDNEIKLTTYDLEIGIKTEISVKSEDIGEFIVNSRLLSDIIKRMPTEDILLEISSNMQVKISGGSTEYTVSAMSAEEYPELPEADSEDKFAVSQGIL